MKSLNQLTILILLLLFSNCKKNEEVITENQHVLPPATKIGANTFGCKINGVVWLPTSGSNSVFASYANGVFHVFGLAEEVHNFSFNVDQRTGIDVFTGFTLSDSILLTSTIPASPGSEINAKGYFNNITPGENIYETDSIYNGYLMITHLDSVSHIISGVFGFNAYSILTHSTVHVTEGRFDVEYIY